MDPTAELQCPKNVAFCKSHNENEKIRWYEEWKKTPELKSIPSASTEKLIDNNNYYSALQENSADMKANEVAE